MADNTKSNGNKLNNLMTEFPCKIPSDFASPKTCPINCRMYEPPWATQIRGGVDGYCAAFYDPENRVDCTKCGTMRLYSGPITSQSSEEIKSNKHKGYWKDRIHKIVDKLPTSVSTEIIQFIKNISN